MSRLNAARLGLALFSFLVTPAVASPPPVPPAAAAAQIHELIASLPHPIADEPVAAAELRRVYGAFGDAPLWQLTPAADVRRQALETALDGAAAQGLRADELHLRALATLAQSPDAPAVAERDMLLTDALLRYAAQLRRGAVDQAALGEDWHIAPEPFDAAAAMIEALRGNEFASFLAGLAPSHPQYAHLVAALQSYRLMANRGGWPMIPGRDEVKLDGRDARLALVHDRLAAEGYLRASGPAAPGDIMGAVRLFQARHGLDPDARLGPRTLAALNVSAAEREAQIAANIERWRHLPHQLGPRYVAVNVADASLDLVENGAEIFHTRVIVGDKRHPSPTIRATITGVTFNPPWNVPPSIAVKEMLPRLRRDPGYLAANDIVIVGRGDDPFGQRIDWRRVSALGFPFRLQQRPGLKNSLGALKLEMTNPWNVYLHDTPAKTLFERTARGFSHGCIRVQQPSELARLLLDDAAWTPDAIAQGMAGGVTRTVPLRRPVPVYVLYATAFVDADGAVNFRDDLYGRDPAIERALGPDNVRPPLRELPSTAECGPAGAAAALKLAG